VKGLGHGQVWWADLEDAGIRPVLALTRRTVAPQLTRILVAPVTTTVRGIPSEVPVGPAEGLAPSVASLDNVQLLSVDRLLRRAGSLAPARWPEVCDAMAHTIGCHLD
jgi:mRNA interferase MazF